MPPLAHHADTAASVSAGARVAERMPPPRPGRRTRAQRAVEGGAGGNPRRIRHAPFCFSRSKALDVGAGSLLGVALGSAPASSALMVPAGPGG